MRKFYRSRSRWWTRCPHCLHILMTKELNFRWLYDQYTQTWETELPASVRLLIALVAVSYCPGELSNGHFVLRWCKLQLTNLTPIACTYKSWLFFRFTPRPMDDRHIVIPFPPKLIHLLPIKYCDLESECLVHAISLKLVIGRTSSEWGFLK